MLAAPSTLMNPGTDGGVIDVAATVVNVFDGSATEPPLLPETTRESPSASKPSSLSAFGFGVPAGPCGPCGPRHPEALGSLRAIRARGTARPGLPAHRAGLSQVELARRACKATSVIGRWERGEVRPSLETLSEVIRAAGLELGVTLSNADPTSTTSP
jgi:DNA-binding XRE family transcriptional regulator